MIDQGFKKLEIYRRAHRLAAEIHRMTLMLPRFETYEEGSQIRRSSKSVSSQIVEGYCLRKYKNDFILYLTRAYASAEETIEHLEYLNETGSLKDEVLFTHLRNECEELCKMLFSFTQQVTQSHETPYSVRESEPPFDGLGD